MRVKKIISGKTDEASPRTKSGTISGARAMPAATVTLAVKPTSVKTAFKKFRMFFSCSTASVLLPVSPDFSSIALNVGMKATDMLFSANKRRNKLGIINATPNASANALVPKKAAFVISRTKPSMREASVKRESFMPAETKECFINFSIPLLPLCGNACKIVKLWKIRFSSR